MMPAKAFAKMMAFGAGLSLSVSGCQAPKTRAAGADHAVRSHHSAKDAAKASIESLPAVFSNPYVVPEDTGARVAPTYFLRRARVQLLRDLDRTDVPVTRKLDLAALAERPFAVAWLGHSAMLMRAGDAWLLLDPALSKTAGPVANFGPTRLTALPIAPTALPRIDAVLISHDHYDHLDLNTMRLLARQPGGPPRFLVGRRLSEWFEREVGTTAEEFDWWDASTIGKTRVIFTPAQHGSGRTLATRNTTLWGGWAVEHAGRRFYFAGDTSYVEALFLDIRARLGPIDMAALPIGAYRPRALMRFDHTDPDDAVRAYLNLGARCAFGVHWGTFQLGDEEPFDAATDITEAVARRGARGFGLLEIGAFADIGDANINRISSSDGTCASASSLMAPAQSTRMTAAENLKQRFD
jgi:N-acyl-phosphatidylethanolamine-hydrolysing phospholipase D